MQLFAPAEMCSFYRNIRKALWVSNLFEFSGVKKHHDWRIWLVLEHPYRSANKTQKVCNNSLIQLEKKSISAVCGVSDVFE
jgi:hypothetical protein